MNVITLLQESPFIVLFLGSGGWVEGGGGMFCLAYLLAFNSMLRVFLLA